MKILITPRSFAKNDPAPLELLHAAGFETVKNVLGTVYSKEQMLASVHDVDGIIVGVDPIDKDVIDAAMKLKAISKYGVGIDNIDVEYAKKRGIAISRTVGANAEAVADYTFALMLTLARRIVQSNSQCREGDWSRVSGVDIYGKTLGVLGLGAIGKGVVRRARGFGMRILAHDINWDEKFASEYSVFQASPNTIIEEADFLTLHLPLTAETVNIINVDALKSMKETAVLVNTARGSLVDEEALIHALKEGQLFGAALDVFSLEPPTNPELYAVDNLIISSHCAAATPGASKQMGLMAAENLIRDLIG